MTSRSPDTEHMDEQAPNTIINALIGAAVAIVLVFIPFSPVLGGGVAGYLDGGDNRAGAIVGALAGLFAALPIAAISILAGAFFLIAPPGFPIRLLIIFLIVLVVISIYTVGLGALGGILGVYLKHEI